MSIIDTVLNFLADPFGQSRRSRIIKAIKNSRKKSRKSPMSDAEVLRWLAATMAAAPPLSDELKDTVADTMERAFGNYDSSQWEVIRSAFYRSSMANLPEVWMPTYMEVIYYLLKRFDYFSPERIARLALLHLDPIGAKFANLDQPEWTESEIIEWYDELAQRPGHSHNKLVIDEYIRKARATGTSSQIYGFLCQVRRKIEMLDEQTEAANEAANAAEAEANSISLLDIWHSWQEQSRKVNQDYAAREMREYYSRENRKHRGY